MTQDAPFAATLPASARQHSGCNGRILRPELRLGHGRMNMTSLLFSGRSRPGPGLGPDSDVTVAVSESDYLSPMIMVMFKFKLPACLDFDRLAASARPRPDPAGGPRPAAGGSGVPTELVTRAVTASLSLLSTGGTGRP